MTHQLLRKAALGTVAGLAGFGLAIGGVTPAFADTVTVQLVGATQGDHASLTCLDPTSSYVNWGLPGQDGSWASWDSISAAADANGGFQFTGVPANQQCTITFRPGSHQDASGNWVDSPYPRQTIGGWMGSPDSNAGFELFFTGPTGDVALGARPLIQAASAAGVVIGLEDPVNSTVTLYSVRADLMTGEREMVLESVAQNLDQTGGWYAFGDLTPGIEYTIEVNSRGFLTTWYGGKVLDINDPNDPEIARFTLAIGQEASLAPIVLTQRGGTIWGTLAGFGPNESPTVTATNLITNSGDSASGSEIVNGAFALVGLEPGVYLLTARGVTSYFSQLVVVAPAASIGVAVTVAPVTHPILGSTLTFVSGTPEAGQTLTATSQSIRTGYGVVPTYSYFWITQDAIIGMGAQFTLPASAADKAVFVVTQTGSATSPSQHSYTVTSVTGKVLLQTAPQFTVEVKGTLQVGKKVKATVSKPVNAKAWKKSYQWMRNGKAIAGKAAKKAVYKLTKKDRGKKISVQVTISRANFIDGVAKSKRTAKIKAK
jgi:hypothetical protein